MDQSEEIPVPNPNESNLQLGFRSSLPNSDPDYSLSDPHTAEDEPTDNNLHEEFQNLDLKEPVIEQPDPKLEPEPETKPQPEPDRHDQNEEGGGGGGEENAKSEDSDKIENEHDDWNGTEKVGGSDEVVKKNERRKYLYPVRPEAEDCAYYIKTGTCKFGSNCKFNHPVRRRNQAVKEKVKETEELTEKTVQTECKYYLRTGGCKYGKACRYNHSRAKTSADPTVQLNFLGLPIRRGEKECPYYMRNGSCKYGANCRFNHPDPTAVGGGDPLSGYGNGVSVSSQANITSWSSPRPLNETVPFVPLMFSPTQGVSSQSPEWNGYQAPVYPPESSMHPPTAYLMNNPATEIGIYTHQPHMLVDEFPERPGQPECSYFLKTGDCKFKSNCKYHHPKTRIMKPPPCTLNDKGLPLRPDQNICTHYSRYGICKFGPACKYDHPVQPPMSGLDQPPLFSDSPATEEARVAASGNGSDASIQQPM